MHFRRLSALALGAWLAGSLLVGSIKVENSRAVDKLIQSPPRQAVESLAKLQELEVRAVLGYHAAETNLLFNRHWEQTQFALGAIVLLGLFFTPKGSKSPFVLCAMMLTAVAFLHWFLTPEMEGLARASVFAGTPAEMAARDRLRSLESGYAAVDYAKLGLGFLMAWVLVWQPRRSRSRSKTTPRLEADVTA